MIAIRTEAEQVLLQRAGKVVGQALQAVAEAIRPGVTTLELDRIAEEVIRSCGAEPSFKGYRGFPATLCTSIDDQVVHGIPSDRAVLREGQIIGIDCGAVLDGYQGDSAFTAAVGEVSEQAKTLIRVTEEAFYLAADAAREGARIGDIGYAVQSHCRKFGFDVVRELSGHGIGTQMHEEPSIPNFGTPGRGVRLRAGMALAIEPMVVTGSYPVVFDSDGWTVRTRDGGLCAHYEHTMIVRPGGQRPLLTTHLALPEGWT